MNLSQRILIWIIKRILNYFCRWLNCICRILTHSFIFRLEIFFKWKFYLFSFSFLSLKWDRHSTMNRSQLCWLRRKVSVGNSIPSITFSSLLLPIGSSVLLFLSWSNESSCISLLKGDEEILWTLGTLSILIQNNSKNTKLYIQITARLQRAIPVF